MNKKDYVSYQKSLADAIRTVRLNGSVESFLRQVYPKQLSQARLTSAFNTYENCLKNVVLPQLTIWKTPQAGTPCFGCQSMNLNDVRNAVRVQGDLGHVSGDVLFKDVVQPMLHQAINGLTFDKYTASNDVTNNTLHAGAYSYDDIVMITKPIGYHRQSGVALRTVQDVNNYSKNLPLLRPVSNTYKREISKLVATYADQNAKIFGNECLIITTTGSSFYVSVTSNDTFTEAEVKALEKKLGIKFDKDDKDTGFFRYTNIPIFCMNIDVDNSKANLNNFIDSQEKFSLLCNLIVSYDNKDSAWQKFKKLYHDEVIKELKK
jgi:hypothetical protein